MEKKFDYNPEAYAPKDFMGNPLFVGDTVVIADRTYSKTPYMIIGVIKKIDIEKTQKGNLKSFRVYLWEYGSSEDTYKFSGGYYDKKWEDFKDEDQDDEDNWTDYFFNSKSFNNILKIK
jgi:hypothetical protein